MISVYLQGIMEPCWDQITVSHADICQQNVFVLHETEFVRSYNPIFANWNCRGSQFITHMPSSVTAGLSQKGQIHLWILRLWSHLPLAFHLEAGEIFHPLTKETHSWDKCALGLLPVAACSAQGLHPSNPAKPTWSLGTGSCSTTPRVPAATFNKAVRSLT